MQHGESLVARSEGGSSAECAPHPDLPHVYTVDAGRLAPGKPFRYVVRRADGTERAERFFAHSLEQSGPVDVWEGIRAIGPRWGGHLGYFPVFKTMPPSTSVQ
ncbi:hypothetical protein [Archangium sp.]|uniref:hypothetical protein n=1 Tax=Archangium sp. TaxID=1872627 RepID=UPI002EDB237B